MREHEPPGAPQQPNAIVNACIKLAQLTDLIDGSDALSEFKRGELRGKIAAKPGLNHYLRTTPAGELRYREDQDRGEPGRQVSAALQRPAAER